MQLADALVTTLREWNLQYLFGVSGANIEHLHDAVHRLGGLGAGRFEAVFAKSEVGAAFMADCRARVHGTLGVCCATSGGGMMNLAVGIAESHADSVPVLAIVGQPPTPLEGRGAFQDSCGRGRSMDAAAMFSAITKYTRRLGEPGEFWECLRDAVWSALSGRPGPAVLLVPRDVFGMEVPPRPRWFPQTVEELRRPQPLPPGRVEELYDAIRQAKRPVLLAGPGLDRSPQAAALTRFARRAGVPVATTLANKGAFPNDDPLYLGTVGVAGEPSAHRYLNTEADLIVAVGTGLSVMTRQPIAAALQRGRLAVVNVELNEFTRSLRPTPVVQADAGRVFAELDTLAERDGIVARRPPVIRSTRFTPTPAPALPRLSGEPPATRPEHPEHPERPDALTQSRAIGVLERFLPEQGHLVFDAGNCAAAALHFLRVPRGVTATIALGMGGMGYAIAGAVGAQLGSMGHAELPGEQPAEASARTVVVCGDGAFLMLGLEIHTAVHYRLPILFVVFNNAMHGMCVTRQQLYFEGRLECSRYPRFSAADVARGLGPAARLWVGEAHTGQELEDALEQHASVADGPGVLELHLTHEEVPPFTPFLPEGADTYDVTASPLPSRLPVPSRRPLREPAVSAAPPASTLIGPRPL